MKALRKVELDCTAHKTLDELALLPNLQVIKVKNCTRFGDDAFDKLVRV